MSESEAFKPERIEKQMATSPEMRAAFKDFRLITPHIYHDRMTLNVDERTMELYYFEKRS